MERCIKLEEPDHDLGYNRIMLLGEAPGETEEKSGMPFVGKAGTLLNNLLLQALIVRAQCVVTNVFHIRPAGNDVMVFFTPEKEKGVTSLQAYPYKKGYLRVELGDEIARLRAELLKWKPKVVVALGATALWAMTGRNGISQFLGQPIPVQSHVVLPVYHPAYLVRAQNPAENTRAVEILVRAKEFANVD